MSADRTQHVIDAIDGALDDWAVGPDAMRWTPEPADVSVQDSRPADIITRLLERSIWFEPARLTTEEHLDVLAEIGRRMAAVASATMGLARSFTVFAEAFDGARVQLADVEVIPTVGFDEAAVCAADDSPRARALRLRRERNTGPSRDLTRQRRPRRLP